MDDARAGDGDASLPPDPPRSRPPPEPREGAGGFDDALASVALDADVDFAAMGAVLDAPLAARGIGGAMAAPMRDGGCAAGGRRGGDIRI